MKLKNILFLGLGMMSSSMLYAQTQPLNSVVNTVMAIYAAELENNPSDYNLLYARANQYMLNGDYNNALADINNALKYTKRSDKELFYEEYMLRTKI